MAKLAIKCYNTQKEYKDNMDEYLALVSFINFVLALFFSFWLLAKNKSKLGSILFIVSSISFFASWRIFNSFLFSTEVIAWQTVYAATLAFIPVLFFHCVLNLLEEKAKKILYFLYPYSFALAAYLGAILMFGQVKQVYLVNILPSAVSLPLAILLVTNYLGLPAYLFFILFKVNNISADSRKMQAKYLTVCTCFFLLAYVSELVQMLHLETGLIGIYFSSVYLVIIAFLLLAERLADIRMILSKVFVYLILSMFVYLFFQAVFLLVPSLMEIFTPFAWFLGMSVSLFFLLIFIPFLGYIQRTSDIIFFKGHNPQNISKDLLIKLSSVIELEPLLDLLASEFNKAIGTDKIGFLVFETDDDDGTEIFKFNSLINISSIFQPSQRLMQKFQAENKMIVRQELQPQDKEIADELDFHHISNLAPLIYQDKVIGLMIIGNKPSGDVFSREDIEFIELIGNQASVAIMNALLYKQVAGLNRKIHEKYQKQTAQLKEKNENIKDLFNITAQRLSLQMHSIKDALKKELTASSAGKKKNSSMRDYYAMAVKTADIVEDVLRASEMDSPDFTLETERVNVKQLLSEMAERKKSEASMQGLDLRFDQSREAMPDIAANKQYLEQAIASLINNAIHYTESGSITLSAQHQNGQAVIRVADTGIGIAKNDIPKLFNKFIRAKNAIAMNEEGSGLGLYIVKKIIDAHPGARVYVEKSVLRKGTTFAISLPAA